MFSFSLNVFFNHLSSISNPPGKNSGFAKKKSRLATDITPKCTSCATLLLSNAKKSVRSILIKLIIRWVLDKVRRGTSCSHTMFLLICVRMCVCVCHNDSWQVSWWPYAHWMPRSNTLSVYLACEKINHREGWDCTTIWAAVSESNRGRQRASSKYPGVRNRGKHSLTSKLIRCWNMRLQDPKQCINVMFICNQVMMTEYTEETGG